MKEKKYKAIFDYPDEILDLTGNPKYFGKIDDPVSASYLRGACGDAMAFYLVIEDNKITEIKYYTDGCYATRACAAITAKLADGKTVKEALSISAGEVIAKLEGLPVDQLHCSILSVSTFYRAIADYLLKV